MAFSLPYFDVRFVGAILVKARPKRNISATIVADVKRFSHQINTDEVFGTHNSALAEAGLPHFHLPGGGHPHMKRRAFITLLGGAAAWPLAARYEIEGLEAMCGPERSWPRAVLGCSGG